jgi:hypothetical protein
MKSARVWFHGLAAAVISGTASAFMAAFALPDKIHLDRDGFVSMGKVAVTAAIFCVSGYLAKSPLWSIQINSEPTSPASATPAPIEKKD